MKEMLYVAKIPEYATVNSKTSSQTVSGPCRMANQAIKGGMKACTRQTTTKVNNERSQQDHMPIFTYKMEHKCKKGNQRHVVIGNTPTSPQNSQGRHVVFLLYNTVQRHPKGACDVENLFDQLIRCFKARPWSTNIPLGNRLPTDRRLIYLCCTVPWIACFDR